jgi:hypothetical protein
METQIPKGVLAIKNIIYIFILCITLSSCFSQKKDRDISVLKVFFDNYRIENKTDSIFLGLDNSNIEIFKTYERYLNSKKEIQEFDFPINEIFLESERDNYRNQTIDKNIWDIDFKFFGNIYLKTDYLNKDEFLYLAKPIYTSNGKYALIYNRNGIKGTYFISSIEVYAKKKKSWRRIYKIKHFGLN